MKIHNGMRPHDIVVLLKIATKGIQSWYMKDLSSELEISASEISESINRSYISGLLLADKKTINKNGLLNFLEFGIKYVFPIQPGARVKGVGTAHNAIPLYNKISGVGQYVWKSKEGNIEGEIIKPLHPKVPIACLKDEKLYELIALVDTIRIGDEQQKNSAMNILREIV